MPFDSVTNMMLNIREGAQIDGRPTPLENTAIRVEIEGGLASVCTERTFKNTGERPMEATLTFPIPPRAVVHALEASIGGRRLRGEVKAKAKAREAYEDGMDRGKASILHEIIASGIHMLSLGQVAPGEQVVVSVTWTMPLSAGLSSEGSLIIPTTIGDIYGKPPMQDSDVPVHAPHVHEATLAVVGNATVTHEGKLLTEEARVRLDAPLTLRVASVEWSKPLVGRARAGRREARISFLPGAVNATPVTGSILVDRSGSMGSVANMKAGTTKHQSAVSGLKLAAEDVRPGDRVRVYEFDNGCQFIGEASDRESFIRLVSSLGEPRGGTELGGALSRVLGHAPEGDVLVLTDGQSYHVDIGGVSTSGRRVHAVYIGEETLQGGLETIVQGTHGESFEAPDRCDDTIITALGAFRRAVLEAPVMDATGQVSSVSGTAGSSVVKVEWTKPSKSKQSSLAEAIAAYATFLSLPHATNAEEMAIEAGIVSDLTSMVLVDEEGVTTEGLSETQKVALTTPRTMAFAASANSMMAASGFMSMSACAGTQTSGGSRSKGVAAAFRSMSIGGGEERARSAPIAGSGWGPSSNLGVLRSPMRSVGVQVPSPTPFITLEMVAAMVDWDRDGAAIQVNGVTAIPAQVMEMLRVLMTDVVLREAAVLGVDARMLLLARAAATVTGSRSASRFARKIIG